MIAALPMYDWPEARAAHDALWAAIRDRLRAGGIAAPEALDRDIAVWDGWRHPDLLLGQVCGLPYRHSIHRHVALVGTLDYGLPGAPPGHYYSHLVVPADAPDPAPGDAPRLAYSEPLSQSGWGNAVAALDALGVAPRATLGTGAHRESARAVAEGRADLAVIDAISWRAVAAHDPGTAARLRIAGRSPSTPGIALVTAMPRHAEALHDAVEAALVPAIADPLGITGLARIDAATYRAVPMPDAPAA